MKRLLLVIAACSSKADPPPLPVAFTDACDKKYDAIPDGEHTATYQSVVVEGFVGLPGGGLLCTNNRCPLPLHATDKLDGKSIDIAVKMGDEPNRMRALPDGYATKDLALITSDNQRLGFGEKVRVTGERTSRGGDEFCTIRVRQIDKPQGLGMSPTDRASPTSDK